MGAATNTSMPNSFHNYLITLVMNLPGVAVGTATIEMLRVVQKGTVGFGAVLTGTFLPARMAARTSNAFLE
jgi:hypothetical protein